MTIERATAVANDTLDATSDTLIVGMTLTPASGEYLAVFSCWFDTPSTTTDGQNNYFSLYVGGTQVDFSERRYEEDGSVNNCEIHMMVVAEVNPNGSQAVEARHRGDSASTPLVCVRRELLLFPVSGIIQDTDGADDTIATATWTTLDNMTETPASGDYLLICNTSAEGPSGVDIGMRLSVGGTPIAASNLVQRQESSWATRAFPFTMVAKINPNGSQVVEAEWARLVGSGTITCYDRSMLLIPVDASDLFEATGTADDVDATTSDNQIDDMLITDPGIDTYLTIFEGYDLTGSISNDTVITTWSVRVAGSKVTDSERIQQHEGSIDDAEIPIAVGARVTLTGGTDDIQMYWQNNTTTSRTMKNRTLIALREAAGGSPQTVVMDELTLAGSSPNISVAPGGVSPLMDELTLAGSAPNLVVATVVSVPMDELTLVGSAPNITLALGPISVALNEITLAGSAPNLAVAPGAIIVSVDELTLVGSAPNLTVTAIVSVALNELTLAGSAPSLTVVPGAITVITTGVTLAGSAPSIAVVGGAVSVVMNELTLAGSAPMLTVNETQTAAPDSTVAIGSWTDEGGGTTNIHLSIDESRDAISDTDYIQSEEVPVTSTYEAGLATVGDPQVSVSHYVRYRYQKDISANTLDLTVRLKQGAVTKATWVHTNVAIGWTTATQELSDAQADSITDYSDLRLEFEADTQ